MSLSRKLGSLIFLLSALLAAPGAVAEPVSGSQPLIGLNTDVQGDTPSKCAIYTQYVDAVRKAGGVPVLLPPMSADELNSVLPHLDGILLIGGDDYPPSLYKQEKHEKTSLMKPARSDFDILLASTVLDKTQLPFLGICAGCQALNIVSSGDLVQDIPALHPESKVQHSSPDPWNKGFNKHEVDLTADSRVAHALNAQKVNVVTSHHQCVGSVGASLDIVGRSADGLPEAIEKKGPRFVVGVQWHPERDFENNKGLFEDFVKQSLKFKQSRALPQKLPG